MPDTAKPFRTHIENILDALAADPTAEAIVDGTRRLTAGQLRDLVHRTARALRGHGLRRGDTVTILGGNLPEILAVRYAAGLLGCPIAHLYDKLSAKAQAAIVDDVDTRALVVDPRFAGRAAEVLAIAPVERVLTLGPAPLGTDLSRTAAGESAEPFPADVRPGDLCVIRHTGGTTGHPKAVCIGYRQAANARPLLPVRPDRVHRQLVCTTLGHGAGLVADQVLGGGGCLVLLPEFDPETVAATIERERVTTLFVLPPLLYRLLDDPAAQRYDLSSLFCVLYGGCASSAERIADAVRRFGPIFMQAYGQNEAGIVSVLRTDEHDPDRPEVLRTAGRLLPRVEVEIRNPSGAPVAPGVDGEVCVRADTVMSGYWKRPDLTAEVLRDGWLHTGDVGRLGEDGHLTIAGRLKDMIIVVGGHVYPAELEDLLNSHPGVSQSAVFGVRDEDRMERVHAVVVRAPGADVGADELCDMVRAERGAMYVPAAIDFADALPLTSTGKPDKELLRTRVAGAAPEAVPAV